MSANDNLSSQQFAPWTEEQARNMAALKRGGDIMKARRKRSGATDQTRFGRISDTQPVKAPSNW